MDAQNSIFADNQLFQLIVDASPAGMIITDVSGVIVKVNSQAQEWFGYDEDELVGQHVEMLLPKEHRGAHVTHRARYMEHTTPRPMARGRDLYGLCKDGTQFPVDISLHPLNTPDGKLILANILDATPRQQAQRVPKERLAAIGEMVTGLAHESRNALQRARGCLDLLELDLEENGEQLDLTKRIRRSLEDLERNYEEVRNYAAPINLDPCIVHMGRLIEETFDDLRFDHESLGVELVVEVEDNAAENNVDTHRMKQVFRNVLENSLAVSPENGEIRAAIARQQREGAWWQVITVTDQGPGMEAEACQKIFDPFYTTKQSGTGLGLAICRRIIEAHLGTISARCSPDCGLLIAIEIPLVRGPQI